MIYGSLCSGIEAATCAWHPLGWTPAFFSEIDKAPSRFLAAKYPAVPNHGDMTKFREWPEHAIDLLVGGTPCQSFSVAGLRKGLADPRGNLMLTYGAIAAKYRPRWLVWENVPGVLSSNGGRDFGSFLWLLGQLGYGFAYRVLDAQYFGVAQRRRRVFVVGCLGDWRSAAAVLFERHSLSGYPAPRRESGKAAPTIPSRSTAGGGLGTDFDCDGGLIQAFGGNKTTGPRDIASALSALSALSAHGGTGRHDFETETFITHSPRGEGFDACEDGTGRGTPLVPVALHNRQDPDISGDITHPLGAQDNGMAVAFHENQRAEVTLNDTAGAVKCAGGKPGQGYPAVMTAMQVRRLTPRECERLQGFPDDYTLIQHRGKPAADGPRYKALGNSWAVPCVRWIGERIAAVDALQFQTMKEAA